MAHGLHRTLTNPRVEIHNHGLQSSRASPGMYMANQYAFNRSRAGLRDGVGVFFWGRSSEMDRLIGQGSGVRRVGDVERPVRGMRTGVARGII